MCAVIKLFGILFILASAVLFGRVYTGERERELEELSAFLGFFRHARERVGSFLEPLPSVGAAYRDEVLERCGFLTAVADGKGLCAAFEASQDKLKLNGDARGAIAAELSMLELGTREGAVSGLGRLVSALDGICSSYGEKTRQCARAVRITAIAAGLGLSILLI